MGLDGLQTSIGGIVGKVKSLVTEKPFQSAVVGSAIVGTGSLIVAKAVKSRKKTKKKSKPKSRKKTTKKKSSGRKLKFGSPAWRKKYIKKGKRKTPKYARTAGKGKDRSTKRIRMTKNGQPYVILKSGKARFIKKSSARRSRKLKGGRY